MIREGCGAARHPDAVASPPVREGAVDEGGRIVDGRHELSPRCELSSPKMCRCLILRSRAIILLATKELYVFPHAHWLVGLSGMYEECSFSQKFSIPASSIALRKA